MDTKWSAFANWTIVHWSIFWTNTALLVHWTSHKHRRWHQICFNDPVRRTFPLLKKKTSPWVECGGKHKMQNHSNRFVTNESNFKLLNFLSDENNNDKQTKNNHKLIWFEQMFNQYSVSQSVCSLVQPIEGKHSNYNNWHLQRKLKFWYDQTWTCVCVCVNRLSCWING